MAKNPKHIQPGTRQVPASLLNYLLKQIYRDMVGGRGINIRPFGNRIVIELSRGGRGSSSSGGGGSTATSVNWTYTVREK